MYKKYLKYKKKYLLEKLKYKRGGAPPIPQEQPPPIPQEQPQEQPPPIPQEQPQEQPPPIPLRRRQRRPPMPPPLHRLPQGPPPPVPRPPPPTSWMRSRYLPGSEPESTLQYIEIRDSLPRIRDKIRQCVISGVKLKGEGKSISIDLSLDGRISMILLIKAQPIRISEEYMDVFATFIPSHPELKYFFNLKLNDLIGKKLVDIKERTFTGKFDQDKHDETITSSYIDFSVRDLEDDSIKRIYFNTFYCDHYNNPHYEKDLREEVPVNLEIVINFYDENRNYLNSSRSLALDYLMR